MKRFALCLGILLMAAPAWPQGSTLVTPQGTYHTFDTPTGSVTVGPQGQTYQRFDNPTGSTIVGPSGQTYQQFNTPAPQPAQPFGNPFGTPQRGGMQGWGK